MKATVKITLLVLCVFALAGCGGGVPRGWEKAAEACGAALAFDQVVQSRGEGYDAQRVRQTISAMQTAAISAANESSQYEQLETLVGNLVFSLDNGDRSAVLDLVAVEGECTQLGFLDDSQK